MSPDKQYPSPAEREKIIETRLKLAETLGELRATIAPEECHKAVETLAEQHGPDTIQRILQKVVNPPYQELLLGGEARLYRDYRHAFARFGGERPLLDKAEYEAETFTYTKIVAKRLIRSAIPFLGKKRSNRERELHDRLLIQAAYWEDITPPAPPSPPTTFTAPPQGDYNAPINQLLRWGWDAVETDTTENEAVMNLTAQDGPQLVEMILAEGLLAGWPGDEATWAPYHALGILGQLRAYGQAADLIDLLGRKNDWLSDRVPGVWGQMGPAAEPALWAYLDDKEHPAEKRGYVLVGLYHIATNFPERRDEIVEKMIDLLRQGSPHDETGNGYLVYVLDHLKAIEAKSVILEAFRQNKIDPAIMQVGDVTFMTQTDRLGNRPWRHRS